MSISNNGNPSCGGINIVLETNWVGKNKNCKFLLCKYRSPK